MTREEAIRQLDGADVAVLNRDFFKFNQAIIMAISAIRQQDVPDTDVGKNEPLTLDELREAAETGDPVWLVGMEYGDGWVRIDGVYSLTVGYSRFGDTETWCFRKASYGVRVLAYRQRPEEGTV